MKLYRQLAEYYFSIESNHRDISDDVEIISELLAGRTDPSLLDLGCGTGRNAALMRQRLGNDGRITGVDLSSDMQKQFEELFSGDTQVVFQKQRIDIPFDLNQKFGMRALLSRLTVRRQRHTTAGWPINYHLDWL